MVITLHVKIVMKMSGNDFTLECCPKNADKIEDFAKASIYEFHFSLLMGTIPQKSHFPGSKLYQRHKGNQKKAGKKVKRSKKAVE